MRRRDRLDSVDAEAIRETRQSRGWRLIKLRMQMELAKKSRELVKNQTEIETATTRGYIRGMEIALQIPDILEKEGTHGISQENS